MNPDWFVVCAINYHDPFCSSRKKEKAEAKLTKQDQGQNSPHVLSWLLFRIFQVGLQDLEIAPLALPRIRLCLVVFHLIRDRETEKERVRETKRKWERENESEFLCLSHTHTRTHSLSIYLSLSLSLPLFSRSISVTQTKAWTRTLSRSRCLYLALLLKR